MATRTLTASLGMNSATVKLVQIARIIIVNGAPEQVPEIVRRSLSLRGRPVDSIKLGERRGRKIWNQPFFEHHPMGNSLQESSVLLVVCIRHIIAFL